ncbi:hypothetical protein DUI87_23341 [Hirundo rustica rustica]|uniref:Uncharacterized protein n=1 Tax=Hirundo rustica rustica TaxID=333673 RepID=A0A3M0JLL1_HIRRU|nr:hypothetical protein DUI87_23341 [Hirundo rustica rustica]
MTQQLVLDHNCSGSIGGGSSGADISKHCEESGCSKSSRIDTGRGTMALALRLILLLLLAVALPARTAQAAPWRAQGAAKPVREGDLASQPTFRMEPLEDAEDWDGSLHFLDTMVNGIMKLLEDAEGKFSVCLSCQKDPLLHQKSVRKEELTGGSSGSVAASAAERKEMPDTVTVTDADKARAGPPTGKNKATGHKESIEAKNSMKEIVEEWHKGHVMDQKSVRKEELPRGRSGSVAASAAERKEMPDTVTVTDADKARAAKPVREGDLDSQPTFRMEPVGGAEGVDQKSVRKEELPRGRSGSVAASAAERKEMPDTVTVTDADKARAGPQRRKEKPTGDSEALEESKPLDQILSELETQRDLDHNLLHLETLVNQGLRILELGDNEPADEGDPVYEDDLDFQPISITEPLGDAEDWDAGNVLPAPWLEDNLDPVGPPTGPPKGKSQATGENRSLKAYELLDQMLSELERQEDMLGKSDTNSQNPPSPPRVFCPQDVRKSCMVGTVVILFTVPLSMVLCYVGFRWWKEKKQKPPKPMKKKKNVEKDKGNTPNPPYGLICTTIH